jgi:hypothetical protein
VPEAVKRTISAQGMRRSINAPVHLELVRGASVRAERRLVHDRLQHGGKAVAQQQGNVPPK